MKTSIRWWSRLAFVAGMGLTTLVACESDRAEGKADEQRTGTLALALQARSPSGSVYVLRNALFQITNVRTGEAVQFLSSEDGLPDAAELTTLLASGSYTVTLLPNWFLERLSGPGDGTGGSPGGFGGTATGGSSSIPPSAGGAFDEGVPFPMLTPDALAEVKALKVTKPPKDGGAAGEASGGSQAVGGSGPISGGAGSIAGSAPVGGSAPAGGTGSIGGAGPVGGAGSTGGEIVDAQLVSDAVQFFFLFGGDETFVNYQFKVGGEIIDFTQGKLHIGISVDDSEACQVPDGVTKPERVLLESNLDAVANISLSSVFEALTTNGGHTGDAGLVYRQIFDSYASAAQATLSGVAHCGDETTNGVPSLNGFPIDCDRLEALHVADMGSFFPTAFVNRIDLAPANGAHCGQQRMIFASNSLGRAFMILEAQIPNPAPELGIDGCRPLAQFWLDQNDNPDAKSRGQRLAQAFLQGGVPGLAEFGFGPFYTAENLTVGSGQIRTNQFDSDPWTLREFKLALDGDAVTAIPFPVAESPSGGLWNESSGLPQGEACRDSFLTALDGVLTDDMSLMSFVVDAACKDAESRNDFSQDYASQLSAGFRSQLADKLLSVGSSLTPEDVANRARFAGSCIGCHNEASGSFLGNGVFAPFSNDFPQVQEFAQQCGDGETGFCFSTSNALNTVFLPGRLQVLGNLLDVPIVPNPCSGGGTGGGMNGGFGGSFGTAGSASAGGPSSGGFATGGTSGKDEGAMMAPPSLPAGPPPPAPVVLIELPSVDEPVEQLQEQEQEIRAEYGDTTISGRSAKVTH